MGPSLEAWKTINEESGSNPFLGEGLRWRGEMSYQGTNLPLAFSSVLPIDREGSFSNPAGKSNALLIEFDETSRLSTQRPNRDSRVLLRFSLDTPFIKNSGIKLPNGKKVFLLYLGDLARNFFILLLQLKDEFFFRLVRIERGIRVGTFTSLKRPRNRKQQQ